MRITLLAFVVLFLSGFTSAAAQSDAEIFGANPEFDMMTLSPDGNRVAFLHSNNGTSRIIVMSLEGRVIGGLDLPNKTKPRWLRFANDRFLIHDASVTTKFPGYRGTHEVWMAISYDIYANKAKQLLVDSQNLEVQLDLSDIVTVQGSDKVIMSALIREAGEAVTSGIFRVDLKSGKGITTNPGTANARFWFANSKGEIVARDEYSGRTNTHKIIALNGRSRKTIFEDRDADIQTIDVEGVHPNDSSILYSAYAGRNKLNSLFELPLDGSQSEGRVVMQHDTHDIDKIIRDRKGVVRGVRYATLTPSYDFFDAKVNAAMGRVLQRFSGLSVDFLSHSADWSKLLLQISGDGRAGSYVLLDVRSNSLTSIAQARSLNESKIAKTLTIEFPARDGINIPTILTLPIGYSNITRLRDAPTIILPHGGPRSHDVLGFDYLAQFLANQGYLVMQPNFRGSSGQGWDWIAAGHGEWGGVMQNDLTDAVTTLVNEGLSDRNRICIVGASYGGYAALAGATLTPDLYRCAVSVNGVADLPFLLSNKVRRSGRYSQTIAFWRRSIGSMKDDGKKIRSVSPVHQAAKAKIPVLLLHGRDDIVVPIKHSENMYNAMKRHGGNVELIRLKGEDHWLSREETRIQVLRHMGTFLAEHLR